MDIFVIKIDTSKNINQELLAQFGYKEFSNKKKSDTHNLAYLMLDRILKEVYKLEKRELDFVNNKPYLKTRAKYFSITHSGDYIALAFSDSECGIDIEKMKSRDFKLISKRMNFSCNKLEDFYKEWTMYEAKYKLGENAKSYYQSTIEDYFLTAVSMNIQETFDIYIQKEELFSNL